jgi:integrase
VAREVGRLTDVQVKALAKVRPDKTRLHHDGGGLYLVVDKRGSSTSWVYRYTIDGRARTLGLGRYPDIGLKDARTRADEARRLKAHGRDPLAVKDAERAARKAEQARAVTFKAVAQEFVSQNRAGWRNAKHAKQWEATLQAYVYPLIGDMVAGAVDGSAVLRVLRQSVGRGKEARPLWEAKPETASRVRGRIEAVLDYAKVRGLRDGDNPAAWRGNLKLALPARTKVQKVKHHEAHPIDGMADFMAALRAQEGMAARALEFAILTAARTGEVLGARWGEIDLGAKVWTVPAERMKAGREHRVPLSDRAIEILKARRSDDAEPRDFVFPGARAGKPLSNMAFLMLLRRMGPEGLTAHGFRSTFRDWAAERTSFPSEFAEAALAHTVGEAKTVAAYQRSDLLERRRKLMAAWAAFCEPKSGGNVAQLRTAGVA